MEIMRIPYLCALSRAGDREPSSAGASGAKTFADGVLAGPGSMRTHTRVTVDDVIAEHTVDPPARVALRRSRAPPPESDAAPRAAGARAPPPSPAAAAPRASTASRIGWHVRRAIAGAGSRARAWNEL